MMVGSLRGLPGRRVDGGRCEGTPGWGITGGRRAPVAYSNSSLGVGDATVRGGRREGTVTT
jgi:hypothetical protein